MDDALTGEGEEHLARWRAWVISTQEGLQAAESMGAQARSLGDARRVEDPRWPDASAATFTWQIRRPDPARYAAELAERLRDFATVTCRPPRFVLRWVDPDPARDGGGTT
jgi:hypothetical protein